MLYTCLVISLDRYKRKINSLIIFSMIFDLLLALTCARAIGNL